MKWLTIEIIKSHSRIDYDCEDALLELYGNAAEQQVMHVLGRSYDEIVKEFGTDDEPIPAALIQASLLVVDESYKMRTASSEQNVYNPPGFDALVSYYIKHTYDVEENK